MIRWEKRKAIVIFTISMTITTAMTAQNWQTTGNGGTDPSANFIGTTDSVDLAFRTNNQQRFVLTASGFIGINNLSPLARLHISNGAVLFEGNTGSTPMSGAGTRMMWIPEKSAFRAGTVGSDEWDDSNIGQGSFAAGENTQASGFGSAAFGSGSTASGGFSLAFGSGSTASGDFSLAFGSGSSATGAFSIALGTSALAQGGFSQSFGTSSQSLGDFSQARGPNAVADGSFAVSEGSNSSAQGDFSFSRGNGAQSEGNFSFATGNGAQAIGDFSFALGSGAIASASFSHAYGNNARSEGAFGFSIGNNSLTTGDFGFSIGSNVTAGADYAFVTGSNSSATGQASFASGHSVTASGLQSFAQGRYAKASGETSMALGVFSEAAANSSFVFGKGVSLSAPLTNNIESSLMIGFNSDLPTLFVGNSAGAGTTGNVGIGTMTPGAKLTVNGLIESTSEGIKFPDGTIQATAAGSAGGVTLDSLKVNEFIKVGNSIFINAKLNMIFTDYDVKIPGSDPYLFIQSNPDFDNHTIINAGNNGSVGIGSPSPQRKLHIYQSGSPSGLRIEQFFTPTATNSFWDILVNDKKLVFTNTGNLTGASTVTLTELGHLGIGLGRDNPVDKLEVEGRARFYSSNGASFLTVGYNGENSIIDNFDNQGDRRLLINYNSGGDVFMGTGVDGGNLFVGNSAGGSIGIGTSNINGYRLAVCGNIRAKEVVVETSWCDYVFDKNYKLRSIQSLKEYIAGNNHLPGIPPGKEVETNGLSIGTMQAMQMEKIEELSLYIIQLYDLITELQKQNKELKKIIKTN